MIVAADADATSDGVTAVDGASDGVPEAGAALVGSGVAAPPEQADMASAATAQNAAPRKGRDNIPIPPHNRVDAGRDGPIPILGIPLSPRNKYADLLSEIADNLAVWALSRRV